MRVWFSLGGGFFLTSRKFSWLLSLGGLVPLLLVTTLTLRLDQFFSVAIESSPAATGFVRRHGVCLKLWSLCFSVSRWVSAVVGRVREVRHLDRISGLWCSCSFSVTDPNLALPWLKLELGVKKLSSMF